MKAKYSCWALCFIALVISSFPARANEAVRAFTDMNGRTVLGILVNYDKCNETVAIQREKDNRICEAPFGQFSAEDQAFILEFHKRHSISISAKLYESKDVGGFKSSEYDNEHVKNFHYKVTFKNCSGDPFRKVDLDYCIFYKQNHRKKTSVWSYDGVQCGSWTLGSVKNREARTMETRKIMLCDKQVANSSLFGQAPGDRGKISGLWVRATITLSDGERTVKELKIPEQINKERVWATASVLVGLNAEKARRSPVVHKVQYVQAEVP